MRMRPFSWVIIAINLLFLAWLVFGALATDVDETCAGQTYREACESGTAIGAGIGAFIIIVIWAVVDVILLVLWLITKPRGYDNPVIATRRSPQPAVNTYSPGPEAFFVPQLDRNARPVAVVGGKAFDSKRLIRRIVTVTAVLVVTVGGSTAGYLIGKDHGRAAVCMDEGIGCGQ